jgi:glutathione S-transferase
MAPHAALEEIGTPHKLVKVDVKGGEHRQPEYLKLNPKGRVPAPWSTAPCSRNRRRT